MTNTSNFLIKEKITTTNTPDEKLSFNAVPKKILYEVEIAKPSDSSEIINLVRSVFPDGNVTKCGSSILEKNLASGKYISLIAKEDSCIIAHAGILIESGIATINSLVVDRTYRGAGLGRKVAEARLTLCNSLENITHIAVYSSLHNINSQRFLDNSFRPIGLCVSEGNPFNLEDSFSEPTKYYWEIALCKPKKDLLKDINFENCPSEIRKRVEDLFYSVRIRENAYVTSSEKESQSPFLAKNTESVNLSKADVEKRVKLLQEKGYVFSGILPNAITGIHEIGFIRRELLSSLPKIKTTQKDREQFVYSTLLTSENPA